MTYHHNSSKKQKTRHSNSSNSSSSDRDDRSLDHSLIGDSLNLGQKNVAQIAFVLTNGTQEVKDLLLNECNIIYECRLCKNMIRSFANLVAHKRIYCKDHQCEQMMLYDPAWFVPEQEKNDVKVEVTPEKPIRNPKISFPPKLDSKTLELKRKSLHSIANSLQKDPQSDDSDTKPISTSQFYSSETKQKEFANTDKSQKDETSTSTSSQRLTREFLSKQTLASLAQTSIEESTFKTETSNQKSSGETSLSTKNSPDIVINSPIMNETSTMVSDHKEVEILDFQVNENSSSFSTATTSVSTTPIVCKKKKHRPNQNSILKRESPNVQKSPKFSEMKPQTLKTVKPVWSGNSNAYGSLLNRHYHNNHHQSILSKESSSLASSSSSIRNNSNVHECPEQVCTKMQTKSDEHNQCNDDHERLANKLRIPIEVITIDSDNEDAYSDEIYAL